jgi:hypothetical protein
MRVLPKVRASATVIVILLAVCGVVLFGASAPVLFLMAKESRTASQAFERYAIEQIHRNETVFHGHAVVLSDDISSETSTQKVIVFGQVWDAEVDGSVHVVIDGRDYSSSAMARIRPAYQSANRYHGFLTLMTLRDKSTDEERLAVCQYIPGSGFPDDVQFRILFVEPNGEVSEESFRYAERTFPLYRTMLARSVFPSTMGFTSNVYCSYPSLFYPILYPWGTGTIGFALLLAVAASVRIKRPRRPQTNDSARSG